MPKETYQGPLEQVGTCCFRIPKSYKQGMRVDGLIFASEQLIEQVKKDQAAEQVANVAFLPGIQTASLAMPDIHWGYGFPIGGVCATDPDEGGVISPGGIGYDINCGVRLMRTNLTFREVQAAAAHPGGGAVSQRAHRRRQVGALSSFAARSWITCSRRAWVICWASGLASQSDVDFTEAHGRLDGADPDLVSDHAKKRGAEQCGTLGSGNHFSGSAGCRFHLRRRSRPGHGSGKGSSLRDDPLRLARPGLSGLRRRPGPHCAMRRRNMASTSPIGSWPAHR